MPGRGQLKQSRDNAATAKLRESRGLQRATPIPAMLQRFLLPETPRAHRQVQTDFQGLLQTWSLCAYLKLPKLAAYASTETFSAFRPPVDLPVQVAHFGLFCISIRTPTTTYRPKPGLVFCCCRDVIVLHQVMLYELNSYIRSFKYALENAPFLSFSLVIDADKRPHDEQERCYNAPACNEVAVIIYGDQDRTQDFRDPSII
ncbi:unnamed protein product [Acanthosepion pharaonis]|uniref:Uncharacterized protein n=1 Tax=Acanthosepion pharaonis TaxID=158019 RepID=A0A812B7N3_ACAPH|nr:unnamed protein product [Sepia pharaonis]